MQVEGMLAFSDDQRTVVSWILAVWTTAVKIDATDATNFVLGHIPAPGSDGMPFLDLDLHFVGYLRFGL